MWNGMADCHFGIFLSVLVNSSRYKGYKTRTVFKESNFGNWDVPKLRQPTTNFTLRKILKDRRPELHRGGILKFLIFEAHT
jgi:hypothetical protein